MEEPDEMAGATPQLRPTRTRAPRTRAPRTRAAAWIAALAAGVATGATLAAPSAQAAPAQAQSLAVAGVLDANGALHVKQTLVFAHGAAPATLSERLVRHVPLVHSRQQVFTISDITASVDGATVSPSVGQDDDATTLTLDTSKAGTKPVVIDYTVTGATSRQGNDTVLSWPVVQGLSVGANQVTGEVQPPRNSTFVDCSAGAPDALNPCRAYGAGTFNSPNPSFQDGPRAAGDEVVLSFGVPASSVAATQRVERVWSLDHAFSTTRGSMLWALLPLVLGALALWALHRRSGRDQVGRSTPIPVAMFAPVGEGRSEFRVLNGVRPGEVGTVVDERVDPVDISATILDLAVRGHLLIVEQPRAGVHAPLDWTFERRENPADELAGYERTLLDAIAPAGAGAVAVSHLGQAVREIIPDVQSQLYDEVVRRGWFARRPDATRDAWTLAGWAGLVLAVVAAGLLVAFTSLGLLGLALVLVALGLVYVAQKMPRRTASGSSLLNGLHALGAQLQVQPTNEAPAGREYAEPARVLPYAVVLGGSHRWVQAIADADNDPGVPDPTDLDWYHAPDTWHLSDLPASLDAFITTVQGQLYRR